MLKKAVGLKINTEKPPQKISNFKHQQYSRNRNFKTPFILHPLKGCCTVHKIKVPEITYYKQINKLLYLLYEYR